MEKNANRTRGTIWFVTGVYWPEDTGTGHYMTGFAEGVAQWVPVRVISTQPTYSKRGTLAPRREDRNGVSIRRVRSTRFDQDSRIGKALNVLTASASLFLVTITSVRSGDQVVVQSSPPTLPYVIAVAARLHGVAYSLIINDAYPEILVAAGLLAPDSQLNKLLTSTQRVLYRHARSIAVVGRDMLERAREVTQSTRARPVFALTPMWADLETITARPRAESFVLERLGIKDKFVVQVAGNIGRLQDMVAVFDAMRVLSDEEGVHWLVVGTGRMRPWLESAVKGARIENVTIIEPVLREQAAEIHQACDIAIVSLIPGMLGCACPSRMYNFLAAGRPVVAMVDSGSETARVIREHSVGVAVDAGRGELLARAIQDRALDAEGTHVMGERAAAVAREHFQRESSVDTLARMLGV